MAVTRTLTHCLANTCKIWRDEHTKCTAGEGADVEDQQSRGAAGRTRAPGGGQAAACCSRSACATRLCHCLRLASSGPAAFQGQHPALLFVLQNAVSLQHEIVQRMSDSICLCAVRLHDLCKHK